MGAKNTYLDHLDNVLFSKKETSEDEITNFLELIGKMSGKIIFPDMTYFAVNYSEKKYVLLKGNFEKTMGHHVMDFFTGGLEFMVNIANKNDFAIYNNSIFKKSLAILNNTAQKEHGNYTFTHNVRIKDRNGKENAVIQKSRYITDPDTGMPVYSYGLTMEITPFKKDASIVHLVDKYEPSEDGGTIKNIITNYYYPNPEDEKLTKREKEIVSWTAEGYSIKQLANKLNLTDSTVTNHRANIMRKTNAKNVAQLIAYAIKNGII